VNGGLAHIEAIPEALLHAVVAIRQSMSAGTAEAGGAWPEPKLIIAELKPGPAFDAETLLEGAPRLIGRSRADAPSPTSSAVALAALAPSSASRHQGRAKRGRRTNWPERALRKPENRLPTSLPMATGAALIGRCSDTSGTVPC
jgi:hypothetical protein